MAQKNLEDIVSSETNLNSGISNKAYVGLKLIGHGLGALFSVGGAYLADIFGYGHYKAAVSFGSQIPDKVGDEGGFHFARWFYERNKRIYQGLMGKLRYMSHSIGYTLRHTPGILLGMGASGLLTYGLSTLYQVPVYIAAIAPRIAEITIDTLSGLLFTKRYRKQLAELEALPSKYSPQPA